MSAPKPGLLSLPPEILLKIFQYLGHANAVLRLGSTCKRLAALYKDDYIWKPLLIKDHQLIKCRHIPIWYPAPSRFTSYLTYKFSVLDLRTPIFKFQVFKFQVRKHR